MTNSNLPIDQDQATTLEAYLRALNEVRPWTLPKSKIKVSLKSFDLVDFMMSGDLPETLVPVLEKFINSGGDLDNFNLSQSALKEFHLLCQHIAKEVIASPPVVDFYKGDPKAFELPLDLTPPSDLIALFGEVSGQTALETFPEQ